MAFRLTWDADAWDDYVYWQIMDKAVLKSINKLLKDMMRDPFSGIGKPEPLVGNLSGFWSRRIDGKNRIVYAVSDDALIIIECRNHYGEK